MAHSGSGITRLVVLVAGVGIGWSVRAMVFPGAPVSEPGEGESAPELEPAQMHVRVTTAAAAIGELPLVVSAAGVVQADPAAVHTLTSRAGGRVQETDAAAGQSVHEGDVLLRLEPAPLQAALLQARALLAQAANQLAEFEGSGRDRRLVELQAATQRAGAQVALLDAQAARLVALHDDGLVSDKALAEAQQAAEQARADRTLAESAASTFAASGAELQHATLLAARDAAEAGVQEAERMLAEAVVVAPCDGQIVLFTARPGARLEPGTSIGELLAPRGRTIVFGVSAVAARDLHVGARVSWNGAQGDRHEGVLVRIGAQVDPTSGLVAATAAPDEDEPPLPPGLAIRGELETSVLTGAVLVPERAVLRAGDEQVVALCTDGKTHRVRVRVAGRHGGLAAVEGEVHAGDRVIVDGGYNLPDGARVFETEPSAASPASYADDGEPDPDER